MVQVGRETSEDSSANPVPALRLLGSLEAEEEMMTQLVLGLSLLGILVAGCAPAACADFAKRELKEHGRVVVWCAK